MVRVEAVAIEAAQLLQRLVLDLADTLPADLKLLAHLRQRVLVSVAQTEAWLNEQLEKAREYRREKSKEPMTSREESELRERLYRAVAR